MKRYFYIFFIASALNSVWEHAHSPLYVHYKSGAITEFVLFRAALFDAAVITAFAFLFLSLWRTKYGIWIMAGALVLFSIALELWAVETGRWAYKEAMPIIPLLNVGLTPAIQLGLLGLLSVLVLQSLILRKYITL